MNEIGLNINVDSYNNEGIKTIKGNNNAEIYKLYILKNKRRLSLVGKTVKLGYVMVGTTNGDIIENLNITNAEQGEITFPITNRISKKDGVYSCQLAIYGADGFLEHTATFGLTVEANIFTKIAGEIADSKDFTYLENILDKASKLSEKLKENTSSATNANSNLESNIIEANNINSKLLENTSTATSLNKNLESNINLAKEVKETIKDLDTKNTEATSNIGQLTDLNTKAEELSNNIQQGLPLNSELKENIKIGQPLVQEATTKNTELQASLEKTKEFISGLDGSQNIPQIRLDVTELQNGLKSNQSLEYSGSYISANETLEGRTEGMIIKGKTMYKKKDGTYTDIWEEGVALEGFGEKEGNKISTLSSGKNLLDISKTVSKNSNIKVQIVDEKVIVQGTSNQWSYVELPVTLIPNIDLTFSFKASGNGFLNANIVDSENTNNSFTGDILANSSKTFRVDKKCNAIIKLFLSGSTTGTFKNEFWNLQLEPGTQVTSYKKYQDPDRKDILLQHLSFDGGLNSLSKTLFDYLSSIKNMAVKRIGRYTFNGNENFTIFQPKHTKCLSVAVENVVESSNNGLDSNNKLCNNFKCVDTYSSDTEGFNIHLNSVRFNILKTKLSAPNVEGLKEWLKANPTTIYYELAKPIETPLDKNINLKTFEENTYFYIENSLPGTLDFKVPSNLGSSLQNLAKEVNNIWDVINNLLVPGILDVNKKVALATIKNNLK